MAVAIAALVGGVGQIAIQWPSLRREGFRYRAGLRSARSRRCGACCVLMGPGTIGLAATQVNLFVNTLLATSQGTGAVSWLTYAFRADVSADRPVRRVDRHGGAAGGLAPRGGRRCGGDPADRVARSRADADAQRAGDARADRARDADRAAAVRARTLSAGRHRGHRGRAAAATRSGWSAIRRRGSCRRCSTRSARAACRRSSARVAIARQRRRSASRWCARSDFGGLALGTSLAAIVNGGGCCWLLRRRLGGLEGAGCRTTLVKVTVGVGGDGGGGRRDSARDGSRAAGTRLMPQVLRLARDHRRRVVMLAAAAMRAARRGVRRRGRHGDGTGTEVARQRRWTAALPVRICPIPDLRMPRYSSPTRSSFSFGPGPLSTALKALIGANVVDVRASRRSCRR